MGKCINLSSFDIQGNSVVNEEEKHENATFTAFIYHDLISPTSFPFPPLLPFQYRPRPRPPFSYMRSCSFSLFLLLIVLTTFLGPAASFLVPSAPLICIATNNKQRHIVRTPPPPSNPPLRFPS